MIPGMKEFLIDYWNVTLRSPPPELHTDPTAIGWFVPVILAAQYPADEDVYNIVWDFYAQGQNVFGTLLSLNAGKFNTPEANRLRMDALANEDDFLTYAAGALGIAMATPAGGLDALLVALRDNPLSATMPATETALAAYGTEAIPKLREWRDRGDLPEPAMRTIASGLDKIALSPSGLKDR